MIFMFVSSYVNNLLIGITFCWGSAMERGVFRGHLEEKQCAVFQQVLSGKKSREIAQTLQMSTKEVEQIVRRTCNQLGARTRIDAARAMAAHYRWTANPHLSESDRRSMPDSDSPVVRAKGVAKDGKTGSVQRNDLPYLLNDRSFSFVRSGRIDSLGSLLNFFGLEPNENSSGHGRRILLILALIVGSTLALSALISAMQGLNTLTSSW
jgi:DNA-binding CsgD family transcriptional regulator